MFAFSVMARDLFADAMGNCSDESVSTRELCRGVFVAEDGELALRAWQVPTANFDSMPSSLGTLARIVTLETWAPGASRPPQSRRRRARECLLPHCHAVFSLSQ